MLAQFHPTPILLNFLSMTLNNTLPLLYVLPSRLLQRVSPTKCGSYFTPLQYTFRDQDSSVSIATRYGLDGPGIESRWGEIFRTRPDRPWGPPSLLYNGYGVFPGVKAAGRGADHPPPPKRRGH